MQLWLFVSVGHAISLTTVVVKRVTITIHHGHWGGGRRRGRGGSCQWWCRCIIVVVVVVIVVGWMLRTIHRKGRWKGRTPGTRRWEGRSSSMIRRQRMRIRMMRHISTVKGRGRRTWQGSPCIVTSHLLLYHLHVWEKTLRCISLRIFDETRGNSIGRYRRGRRWCCLFLFFFFLIEWLGTFDWLATIVLVFLLCSSNVVRCLIPTCNSSITFISRERRVWIKRTSKSLMTACICTTRSGTGSDSSGHGATAGSIANVPARILVQPSPWQGCCHCCCCCWCIGWTSSLLQGKKNGNAILIIFGYDGCLWHHGDCHDDDDEWRWGGGEDSFLESSQDLNCLCVCAFLSMQWYLIKDII